MKNIFLYAVSGKVTEEDKDLGARCDEVCVLGESLFVCANDVLFKWVGSDGEKFYVIGNVFGVRGIDGNISNTYEVEDTFNSQNKMVDVEGRFVVIKILRNGVCELWTDQFGRVDVYWQKKDGRIIISTEMEALPVGKGGANPSQLSFAHALTVYGMRPPKEDTYYEGVHRLGINKSARFVNGKFEVNSQKFYPQNIEDYDDLKLHEYADILIEAVRSRASSEGNVVYLSSGWDSTSILAILVHLFGKRKVRAVIGRMQYADRSGVINQFEIDRARAVAEFFEIKLDICEFDYRDKAPERYQEVRPLFKSQQFSMLAGFHHWLLAKYTAQTANCNEVVFAGEISDGAHNFGFSQYFTIFHPSSIEFREYSDKMASHLFGPTFIKSIIAGQHEKDPVWQLFRHRSGELEFDEVCVNPANRIRQILASFFLRGGRLPLTSMNNTKFLTKTGRDEYSAKYEDNYLLEAANGANAENIYSWYLHLYNSFHWQGSSVATLEPTAASHGLKCALPFLDSRLIHFLSAMPENWGRGLELKPTKYPLKWMLENRIKYPLHLQVGPHSYTYDVDPEFNLQAEVLFASSMSPYFKERLKQMCYGDLLDPNLFDIDYIEKIIRKYTSGEEFRGLEMSDLGALAYMSIAGTYCE